MKNSLGREIPDKLLKELNREVFKGAFAYRGSGKRASVHSRTVYPGEKKLLGSLREAVEAGGLGDGMTISFHHHLRNGDYLIRRVLEVVKELGIGGLTLAPSALFDCHAFLVDYIKDGTIARIECNYMTGRIAEEISSGILEKPVIMRSHGGRDRALEAGDLKVDIAFIAAPAADTYGNLNGIEGPSAFGSFGYAFADARYARCVVAVTDNLLPYPLARVSIDQTLVDYVVPVERIGDSKGIVSGTTQITRDPLGRQIAKLTVDAIEASGYFKNGFSLQTGAGGISLAAAAYIHERMKLTGVKGSFGLGGITKPMVDILEDGLFEVLLDTQCFDLDAVRSLRRNQNHREISCSVYSGPHTKGAVVNQLDVVILGATEIDVDFNVNVTTSSDGVIMGGSGGHADASAGGKLCIIVANLNRARFPTIVDAVGTVNTPGQTVDLLVTDRGLAVNPQREDLRERLTAAGLPVADIHSLRKTALDLCGAGQPLEFTDKIIAAVEYRDGTLIDVIRLAE